jgi:hypothetical protein
MPFRFVVPTCHFHRRASPRKLFYEVKGNVDKHMESSPYLSITSDGWSNIKNEPIVNYVAVSASATLFLESVSTGETAHDAKFIAEDIARVMSQVSNTTSCIVGAVTDNTSSNKAAWILLKQRYPVDFSKAVPPMFSTN